MENIKKQILLLFLLLFPAFIQAYSQKITLPERSITIKEAFEEIEKQTDLTVAYSESVINVNRSITVKIKEKPLPEAMMAILKGSDTSFRIDGKQIIILKGEGNPASGTGYKRHISGVVTDGNGEPIVGASVEEKGAGNGIVTDTYGRYSLDVSDRAVLEIRYLGYAVQDIAVGNRTNIDVSLREEAQGLDEVVVVGYGVQKKRDLTGSVASIKMTDIPVQTFSTISQTLAGKAAGLQVTQNTAQVGGASTFRIRGETSINAGNSPLIIVDGFPVSNASTPGGAAFDIGSVDNVLANISPNDIESIEVLKDASATAIYGSRAGHGVIIITTKRGDKNEKVNVNYSGNFSVSSATSDIKMLNASQYMTQRNKDNYEQWMVNNAQGVYAAYRKAPTTIIPYSPTYSDADIAAAQTTDWVNEITRTGLQQSHNVSMTGGSNRTQYLISLNYFNQEGIVKNNDMTRVTGNINLDQQISRLVKAGVTLNINRNKYNNIPLGSGDNEASGIIGAAMRFSPIIPVYNEDGSYALNPEQSAIANPVSYLDITDEMTQDRVLGSLYTQIEPTKGLIFKVMIGADRRNSKRGQYTPRTVKYGAGSNGRASVGENDDIDYLTEWTANYSKTIGDHNLTALAGYSYQQFNWQTLYAGNTDFITDGFLYNSLGSGAGVKPSVDSSAGKSAMASYFGRLNYSYLGKYLLTATLRVDGASNFNPDYRWGYFPSASFGWRFSDESFTASFRDILSNGKLRIGYGETGNSNVGNRTLDLYSTGGADAAIGSTDEIGIRASSLGNPKITWETTSEFNIGLDLGFLKNRINITADYYNRIVSNLLASKSLMSYNEVSSIYDNIGETQGTGFELALNTVNIQQKNLRWTTDFTFSVYRDRWKERAPDWKPAVYQSVNDPIRATFGYVSDGLLQAGEPAPAWSPNLLPGQVVLKDLSGPDGVPDGLLNSYDMVMYGGKTSDPSCYFGLNNTVQWKNFDFNIFFYGEANRLKGTSYYEYFGILGSPGVAAPGYNASTIALDTWHADNQSSVNPNPVGWGSVSKGDYYYKRISYLRCRNITLGYSFPAIDKVFSKLRIYADVNNPFIFTNWTGLDPETDNNQYAYPNVTSFNLGINITF
ncbi:MAG: TonB-dependent receptor [Dysgonamonadaceae bacterium]|jgi:TonB-linked SusC/RagA family outer membrane protein|nr:TonB-dependent receptor [Dysgonamonadaceae bacterium]